MARDVGDKNSNFNWPGLGPDPGRTIESGGADPSPGQLKFEFLLEEDNHTKQMENDSKQSENDPKQSKNDPKRSENDPKRSEK